MTPIRDLIDIPERVHRDDFVLRLSEGVAKPAETLRTYVVTPQLADAFDRALDLIKGALASGSSKAAYLHGSFGSGKSHFMAVLHLLLQQHAEARAAEGLEGVVTRHGDWLAGRRFLLAPYHMIGKPSLEAAVLGGYAARVAELHPDAPTPGVYRSAGLFDDARRLRAQIGDEAFFDRVNETAASTTASAAGWGDLSARWDAASFEAALGAPAGAEERSRLVAALVDSFFRGYRDVARGSDEAFVPLDEGLAVIARHARDLGYDALVLFLDELILWLATHAADLRFLNEEGPKVSKLVEAETAGRAVPIVSFVARQRDLRELVGEQVTGALQLGFADVLQWWEARFERITLEDRNLPEIAARRLLRPRSEAARRQIDDAYAQTEKVRREVFETLLTPRADTAAFRKVYPFSPALVETLVAVSSLLQRERTALKVMLQLLVDGRDTLDLGEIVPVGDLFDAIAEGDEPFTEGARHHFENARNLYRRKLLPLIEGRHGISKAEAAARPRDDRTARALRADDRLAKTLLLSALAPEVDALKNLTAARLAALNHGSIRTPIEGREGQEVLRRCRAWAAEIGDVRIGDDPANPVITLQLSAVDTEGILAGAGRHDNAGNRRRLVREVLFDALGIENRDELVLYHDAAWRGTQRRFEVIFANVRELPDESLATRGDERKVVIDFPFDDPGHTPADDLARLNDFRGRDARARTLVWLPSFLSPSAQRDLGTLVRIDHVLAGERLRDFATHLSPVDQASARELLRNQQSQLRQRLIHYLEGAYGVENPIPGSVDESHPPAEHFQSLDPAFEPRPPARANLREALGNLFDQLCASHYPVHPDFGASVRTPALRRVHEQVSRAVQEPEGRVAIDKPLRPSMAQIAVPLRLGEMGETHFVVGRHWFSRFERLDKPLTVGKLREAMDHPRRMGLPAAAANLVILVYADQANLAFRRHGGPWPAKLDDLPDDVELREEALPAQEAWTTAVERAGRVFGLTVSPLRNASNVSDLAERLGEAAAKQGAACDTLVERLAALGADFSIDEEDAKRLRTARASRALVQSLTAPRGRARIENLAETQPATSLEAMGTSIGKAGAVVDALERTHWQLFAPLARLTDDRADDAQRLLSDLREALAADEYAVALAPRLPDLAHRAANLLARPPLTVTPTPTPPATGAEDEPSQPAGQETGRGGAAVREDAGGEFEGGGPAGQLDDGGAGDQLGGGGTGGQLEGGGAAGSGVGATITPQGSRGGLDAERLREVTAGLDELLRKEPGARLEITWKLRRGEKDGA